MDSVKLVALLLAVGLGWGPKAAQAAEPEGPYYDASNDTLFLPLKGTPADVDVSHVRTLVSVDLRGVESPFVEMSGRIDQSPLITAFQAQVNPSTRRLHLIVTGTVALDVQVEQVEDAGLLFHLSPRYGAVPPSGQAVHQQITLVPRSGTLIETYDPDREARWPVLDAKRLPAPPVMPAFGGLTLAVLPDVSLSYGSLAEQYAPEALSVSVPEVASLQANGALKPGGLSVPFRLGRRGFAFEDPDYPEVFHSHVDTSLSAAVAKPFQLAGIDLESGIGYQGLLTQVTNTTAPPSQPAPSRFFFASQQVLHGPFLYQRIDSPSYGPLAATLELSWAPFMWMTAEDTSPLSGLMGWRIEPGLRLWPGVSLGYFWEGVSGASFSRHSSGLWLGVTFSGL